MFEFFDWLTALVADTLDSPWLWVTAFLVSGLDAILPFMPSETTVVTVAVLLGGDLKLLALLAVLAAGGALAGDCLSYGIGRWAGPRAIARLQRGERGRQRYAWAQAKVTEHAAVLVIAGRYLPGGRVASGLASGSLRMPIRRFVCFDAIGVSLWAVYSTTIGYLGGASFAHEPSKGLLLAFGIGLGIVALIEVGRRVDVRALRSRRGSRDIASRTGHALRRSAHGRGRGGAERGRANMSAVDDRAVGSTHRAGAFVGTRLDR